MQISRATSYGLQATILLAQQGDDSLSCRIIAKQGKLPERYLLQVLRMLVRRGILKSARGFEGGYRLGRPADQITLLDLTEAIQGPIKLKLPSVGQWPGHTSDVLQSTISEVTSCTRDRMRDVTLADLIPPVSKKPVAP